MGVYTGEDGSIAVQRRSDADAITFRIAPDGINVTNRRVQAWSLDGELLPGDRIKLKGVDSATLDFVDDANWEGGTPGNQLIAYVWPDEAGGFRLFNSYEDAVNANQANALTLQTIASPIDCTMQLVGSLPRLVAQVTNFSFRTGREQIDTTSIGEVFANAYGSRISGQGDLTAQFDCYYTSDAIYRAIGEQPAILFAQMLLRAQVGSVFDAQFTLLKDTDGDPICWYEASCALTDVGTQQAGDGIVNLNCSFLTLDDIRLRVRSAAAPGGLLLQEQSNGEFVLEDDSGSLGI